MATDKYAVDPKTFPVSMLGLDWLFPNDDYHQTAESLKKEKVRWMEKRYGSRLPGIQRTGDEVI